MKIHLIDLRLRTNAGIDFPTCKATAKMLDLDAARLPLTDEIRAVTCKHCLKIHRYNNPF